MKRIRNAAVLAAVLAMSSFAQADTPNGARQRAQLDEATATRAPHVHKHVDRDDQSYAQGMDYTQEGRLNQKARLEERKKAREEKHREREAAQ